ncbi:MAG: bifunctional nuclease family protein [Odoribacteraceae bacterium]|jgi:bifunctional DNase/RNase|nr:bifunctional nuclease family protein [Odoribacteraceae bacterium]
MDKIKLTLAGISCSVSHPGIYAIILVDDEGHYRVPVITGENEARAISEQLEYTPGRRPTTHDLLKNILDNTGITPVEIHIHQWQAGIFLARIQLALPRGDLFIDARVSDAIAIAARFDIPVYISRQVFQQTAMIATGNDLVPGHLATPRTLGTLTVEQLTRLMEEAVKKEDYEKASLYRDELNNRKNK